MRGARLTEAQARFVGLSRVARLATASADGGPHVVPICPALDGNRLVFASEPDAKIRNLRANARAALVFDSYHEDWDANHQVTIRGSATVMAEGPEWTRGKQLLDEKYPQYEPLFPITHGRTLVVWIEVEQVTSEGVEPGDQG